jgi:hypothetical protein
MCLDYMIGLFTLSIVYSITVCWVPNSLPVIVVYPSEEIIRKNQMQSYPYGANNVMDNKTSKTRILKHTRNRGT